MIPCSIAEGQVAVARIERGEVIRSGVLVHVPGALRSYTQGQDEILIEAGSLSELLGRLEEAFPGIRDRIVDEAGRTRKFVNLFLNEELVRGPLERVRLSPGDVVHVLPSVAGGRVG